MMITLVEKMFSLTMAREAALNRGQEMELLLVKRRKMLSQKFKIWRKIVSSQSTNEWRQSLATLALRPG